MNPKSAKIAGYRKSAKSKKIAPPGNSKLATSAGFLVAPNANVLQKKSGKTKWKSAEPVKFSLR